MTFDGSEIGRIVGRAGDRAFHRKVVKAALEMFTHDTPPGKVVTKEVREEVVMSRTTRRAFAKAVAAAGAALPLISSDLLAQTPAPQAQSPLAEALAGVVSAQSGQYLDAADLDRIRADFKDYVPVLERLRNVKLANSDEPDYTFASLTKRWS